MMRGCWMVLGFILSLPAIAIEPEGPPPTIPNRPDAELFNDAPAPWRDYLLAARRAEAIEDSLQRCIAYPDIPGNQWPAGHAEAHCRGHVPSALTAETLNGLLDGGRFDEVGQHLDALLSRHFSQSDFSEDIDYVFDGFGGNSPAVDSRTSAWLHARPDSPYAHLARGVYLLNMGIDARGEEYIQETPASKIREMKQWIAQAVPELEAAARLQPKLMPAYAWLVKAAMYDNSFAAEAKAAVAAAGSQDSACQTMFLRRMDALRPRWGGSWDAMFALASEVKRHVASRPQLAIYLSQPYAERGMLLTHGATFGHDAVELLDYAVQKGSLEDALSDAANASLNANDESRNPWKALAYLLQESRFRDGGRWADVNIARLLLRDEPVLAWRYAQRVLAWKPDDADANFYFAGANASIGRFEVADRHLRVAMQDRDFLEECLDRLISMWLFHSGLPRSEAAAKVVPDIDRMIREFPDQGRARMYRIESGMHAGGMVRTEWIRDFLTRMNPDDPVQVDYKQHLDKWLDANPGLRERVNRAMLQGGN